MAGEGVSLFRRNKQVTAVSGTRACCIKPSQEDFYSSKDFLLFDILFV
jgi:hypothetical protein